jgi:hypothetical protein
MRALRHELDSDTLLLNLAVIPPDDVAAAAITLSQRTARLGGLFELDGKSRHAHLTLYMARFLRSSIEDVQSAICKMLPSIERQRVTHSGYELTPQGYYEISYAKTLELRGLHDRATLELHTIRYRRAEPIIEDYFGEYRGRVRSNVETWGYDLANELYRPHITLTRFVDSGRAVQPASLPRPRGDLSFTLEQLGLFCADSLGTARGMLSRFSLDEGR